MAERWTEETEQLVFAYLVDQFPNSTTNDHIYGAQGILQRLAAVGALVSPETPRCGLAHPDYPYIRCDRPAMHNHHGGNDEDGVTRELWLDSHVGKANEEGAEHGA